MRVFPAESLANSHAMTAGTGKQVTCFCFQPEVEEKLSQTQRRRPVLALMMPPTNPLLGSRGISTSSVIRMSASRRSPRRGCRKVTPAAVFS